MAVLTQVRVATERYKLASYDFQIAEQSAQVDQRLASISRAGSDNSLTSDLETLRTQARSIVSRFQEASSYAEAQAAYGRVLNSVGIDLLPDQVTKTDVASLSRQIATSLRQQEAAYLLVPRASAWKNTDCDSDYARAVRRVTWCCRTVGWPCD
ncbi:hypothetical protein ACSPAH_01125 [Buttiauxella agrestis]